MTKRTGPSGGPIIPSRSAPMMNYSWALPVGCYSVLVKHVAVIRAFPGGVRAFERAYQPQRKNWVLFMLNPFNREELDQLLARLNHDGLVPGVDVAVADKLCRPVLESAGITFSARARLGMTVEICSEPNAANGGVVARRSPAAVPATRDADGKPLPGMINLVHGGRVFCVPEDEDEEIAWSGLREEVLAARMIAWLGKHAAVQDAQRQPPASQRPDPDGREGC